MFEVHVGARSMSPFVELVGGPRIEAVARLAEATSARLGGRTVWNVNSTAAGGGVAEMLQSILRYGRGLGVDVRWAVMEGAPDFFNVTKRIHDALHDDLGDGGALGAAELAIYDRVTRENVEELQKIIRRGDIVICHDPQTAGLVRPLRALGALVVFRCHIGYEEGGSRAAEGWSFLRPYLEDVPIAVFSRKAYAPAWMPHPRAVVLPPTIDPFAVKNRWMPASTGHAILRQCGLLRGTGDPHAAIFVRDDGTTGFVMHTAHVVRDGLPPLEETPLVVQVSRWDRMKDHLGVLEAFARMADAPEARLAELVLTGPSVLGVADDPEGPAVFREVETAWASLPPPIRRRAHLVQLPMDDVEENAAMVDALQRHATVIVQKSLREGFGLTVTEAMWKRRPVIASAIGGIRDQIHDGIDGILVQDPTTPDETANAIRRVLADRELGARLGEAAYDHVKRDYLSVNSLERWADLLRTLLELEGAPAVDPAAARASQPRAG